MLRPNIITAPSRHCFIAQARENGRGPSRASQSSRPPATAGQRRPINRQTRWCSFGRTQSHPSERSPSRQTSRGCHALRATFAQLRHWTAVDRSQHVSVRRDPNDCDVRPAPDLGKVPVAGERVDAAVVDHRRVCVSSPLLEGVSATHHRFDVIRSKRGHTREFWLCHPQCSSKT